MEKLLKEERDLLREILISFAESIDENDKRHLIVDNIFEKINVETTEELKERKELI